MKHLTYIREVFINITNKKSMSMTADAIGISLSKLICKLMSMVADAINTAIACYYILF